MRSQPGEMFASHRVASCRGVDDAREALSRVFLPVDFPSTPASRLIGLELNALTVSQLTFGYMRFRSAVRIETAEASNFHIDIPTAGRAVMRAALGTRVFGTPQTAAVFMPGRPVELDAADGFAQLSLMIPRDQLQLELEQLVGAELARPIEFDAALDVTTPGGQLVLQAIRIVDEASGQNDGPLMHPLAAQRLEQVVVHSLLFAQPHNHSAALASPARAAGARPVSMAVELLRSDLAHPWTVAELAAEVSVSVRTLQEGFRRSVDTTPMKYLRRLRLQQVHDELVAAAPGAVTVTDVAAKWGFVHLGRFAAAYRSEFAELPSDTARSARGQRRT